MTRWITISAVSLTVLASLACGGDMSSGGSMGGGGSGNKAACEAWLEKQNALPCTKMAQIEVGQVCTDALNQGIDLTKYYSCMEENAKCSADNPDIPDFAGQTNCQM